MLINVISTQFNIDVYLVIIIVVVFRVAHECYAKTAMSRQHYPKSRLYYSESRQNLISLGFQLLLSCQYFAVCINIKQKLLSLDITNKNLVINILNLSVSVLNPCISILDMSVFIMLINAIRAQFNIAMHLVIIIVVVCLVAHECHAKIDMSRQYYTKSGLYYSESIFLHPE